MSDTNPYGQGTYGNPTQPTGMPPLATHGQRFLARLIDTALLIALGLLFGLIINGTASFRVGDGANGGQGVGFGKQILTGGLTYVGYFLYEGVMLSRTGQTLGKMALRIRVAQLANGDVPRGSGWLRAAVYVLPGILSTVCVGVLFWLLNVLWCTWDKPYRQCLHDKAAKTVVVQVG